MKHERIAGSLMGLTPVVTYFFVEETTRNTQAAFWAVFVVVLFMLFLLVIADALMGAIKDNNKQQV